MLDDPDDERRRERLDSHRCVDLDGRRVGIRYPVDVPLVGEAGETLRALMPLAQALDIAERFDPADVGVVVDTFHVWWEPGVADQLQRAGQRVVSYQICDWITPLPADTLLARGMMGDGHIDFPTFTRSVAAAGYRGDVEVEIFNAELWKAPPAWVVDTMIKRYLELVQPYLAE